jgi:hypothetical protein
MKTTLEIPDELYRQAQRQAAHENRKLKDLVSDGLRLLLGLTKRETSQASESNNSVAQQSQAQRKAMAALEEIRRHPMPSARVRELIEEMSRAREAGWSRGDLEG